MKWLPTMEFAVVRERIQSEIFETNVGVVQHAWAIKGVITAIKQKFRDVDTGEIEWRDVPEFEG